ncbi:putative pilin structural protein SafD [Serratia fonticola]|uniref:AfaD family invasin n=1 Tax=Serratia fonticola TaxID=47917 RepID=UPI002176F597|nr:AfaD family invasin [Serratia fonticola]CAI1728219.1 putative pilin structural protein SafD [Serratia fonticola]
MCLTEKKYMGSLMGMLLVFLPLSMAAATEAPRIIVRMHEQVNTGHVADGKRLGEGRISLHELHTGFQIWSEAPKSTERPERYVLTGRQSDAHKLRVRLEGNDWEPDTKTGEGLILNTGDDAARFFIVVDGEQKIVADNYPIQITGVALTP